MPLECPHFLPIHVPQSQFVIVRSRYDLGIRGVLWPNEANARNPTQMARQCSEALSSGRIPNLVTRISQTRKAQLHHYPNRVVRASRDELVPHSLDAQHTFRVALELSHRVLRSRRLSLPNM